MPCLLTVGYCHRRNHRFFLKILAVLFVAGLLSAHTLETSEVSTAKAALQDGFLYGSRHEADDLIARETSGAVPTGLLGVWKGDILMDPKFGYHTFSALLALVNGSVGEMIGTAAHPSVACGGEMRLQNATSDTIVVTSDYTFGPCLDGNHVLRLASDGTMLYEWHDPNSSRVDRGTLTRVGGLGDAMPNGHIGVWKGDIQMDPEFGNSTFPALVTLVGGSIEHIMGTIAHPSSGCGGEMTLQSVAGDTITDRVHYTYGPCLDGSHVLRLASDGTMLYEWHDPNSSRIDTGILTRISGPSTEACSLPSFGDSDGNPMRQGVGTWAGLPYGGTDYVHNGQTIFLPFRYYGGGRDTIATWGCYLTSSAMAVNYYAQQQAQTFRTDPGRLNNWLQHNNGYSTGAPLPSLQNPQYVNTSLVIPSKVAEYANANGVQMALVGQDRVCVQEGETAGQFRERTRATLDASMCAHNAVILGVTSTFGQHYVDATGRERVAGVDTWRIHDPLLPTSTTLQEEYDNSYNQIVRFSGDRPDRALSFALHSPAEIVVTDPEGRQAGFDPRTRTLLLEIPGSSYGVESLGAADGNGGTLEQTVLHITTPGLGQYTLQVIGTDSGSYALDVLAIDNNGQGALVKIGGATSPGAVDLFIATYSGNTGRPIQLAELIHNVYLPLILRQ